jgi:hypothetical protein
VTFQVVRGASGVMFWPRFPFEPPPSMVKAVTA